MKIKLLVHFNVLINNYMRYFELLENKYPLLAAVIDNGKLYRGKPFDTHYDIINDNSLSNGSNTKKVFVDDHGNIFNRQSAMEFVRSLPEYHNKFPEKYGNMLTAEMLFGL